MQFPSIGRCVHMTHAAQCTIHTHTHTYVLYCTPRLRASAVTAICHERCVVTTKHLQQPILYSRWMSVRLMLMQYITWQMESLDIAPPDQDSKRLNDSVWDGIHSLEVTLCKAHTYTHTHTYTQTLTYEHTYMDGLLAHAYTCMYTDTHMHTHTHAHTHSDTYGHTHRHVRMHNHTHPHTHTHTHGVQTRRQ